MPLYKRCPGVARRTVQDRACRPLSTLTQQSTFLVQCDQCGQDKPGNLTPLEDGSWICRPCLQQRKAAADMARKRARAEVLANYVPGEPGSVEDGEEARDWLR